MKKWGKGEMLLLVILQVVLLIILYHHKLVHSILINRVTQNLTEPGSGRLKLDQQIAIAWVYYNRLSEAKWINKSLDECLKGYSYAYKNLHAKKPAPDVMVVMVAFGNKKYAGENSGVGTFTIQQLVNTRNANTKYYHDYIQKRRLLKLEIIKSFKIPTENLFTRYTNQGYWRDLCKSVILRSDDSDVRENQPKIGGLKDKISTKDIMWVLPMLYFYFQKVKKVDNDYDNKYVTELRTLGENSILKATTFIFKLQEIMKFFKDNPSLMPEVYMEIPYYNYKTGEVLFLKK